MLRWRLPASVLTARFLDDSDKAWLLQQLAASNSGGGSGGGDNSSSSSSSHASGSMGLQQMLEAGAKGSSSPAHASVFRLSDSSGGAPALPGLQGSSSADCQLERGDGDHAALLSKQQQPPHGDAGSMSAGQQVLATLRNPLILYLMLLKALKVQGAPVMHCLMRMHQARLLLAHGSS